MKSKPDYYLLRYATLLLRSGVHKDENSLIMASFGQIQLKGKSTIDESVISHFI